MQILPTKILIPSHSYSDRMLTWSNIRKESHFKKKRQPPEHCAQTETDSSYQHGATSDPNIANHPTTYLNLTQNLNLDSWRS